MTHLKGEIIGMKGNVPFSFTQIFFEQWILVNTGKDNTTRHFKPVQGVYNARKWLAQTLGLLFWILAVETLPAIIRFQTKECSTDPAVQCEPEPEKPWCPTGYTSPFTFPCVPKHFHLCVLCSMAKMAVNAQILRKYTRFNVTRPFAPLGLTSTNVKILSVALTR